MARSVALEKCEALLKAKEGLIASPQIFERGVRTLRDLEFMARSEAFEKCEALLKAKEGLIASPQLTRGG